VSFEHLKRYEIRDRTAEMTLDVINGSPVLILAPFTEQNRPLLAEILRMNKSSARTTLFNEKDIDKTTAYHKELCAKYVLRGWRNVFDSKGASVLFSEEAAAEFLEALPNWLFTQIRLFAMESSNFIDTEGEQELLGN